MACSGYYGLLPSENYDCEDVPEQHFQFEKINRQLRKRWRTRSGLTFM